MSGSIVACINTLSVEFSGCDTCYFREGLIHCFVHFVVGSECRVSLLYIYLFIVYYFLVVIVTIFREGSTASDTQVKEN